MEFQSSEMHGNLEKAHRGKRTCYQYATKTASLKMGATNQCWKKMSTYAGSEPTVVHVVVLGSTDWAVQLSLAPHRYFLHSQWCSGVSVTGSLQYMLSSPQTKDRLVGLVVKASASRAEDPGFESRLQGFFRGRVIPVTSKLTLQWLPCQAPGVIGSALGLVGPVSVYCGWVR